MTGETIGAIVAMLIAVAVFATLVPPGPIGSGDIQIRVVMPGAAP